MDMIETGVLFQPKQIAQTQLSNFMAYCAIHTGERFADYQSFERFCHQQYRSFWRLFLAWSALPIAGDATEVCRGDHCETALFFPEVSLNYTEVLLDGADERGAIIACHRDRPPQRLSRRDLQYRTMVLVGLLRRLGIKPGDRVAVIGRNNAEVIIAALATAAIGATFASCAPDMGVESIAMRFEPLNPVVMLANLRAEPWDVGEPVAQRVATVIARLPSVRALIALDEGTCDTGLPVHQWHDAEPYKGSLPRFPFNHPLYIMFSSGTTGIPKCIIHGAGGTLLEHLKEHRLHGDMRSGERLLFQTSCGWMMWNWQLSALAVGTELVLYDGPMDNPETLWRLVSEHDITCFGTNPAYLQFCEAANFSPREISDYPALRSILSTGSILYPHQFDWIRREVKSLFVQSISGGTDIIGCFVLGNPNLPVHRGEAQCRSLGLDVRAIGNDLVCATPFPSRPLGFLNDDGSRFHAAYFSQHPDVWTHGDLIEFTPHGGAILHGRSDGVLNIRGVRIGPADIYHLLRGIPAIIEAMAVEQHDEREPGGNRLILLVVTKQPVDSALRAQIRQHLITHGTAVMVPSEIIQVTELPVTHNGKRSEAAARDVVNGRAISNLEALRNPECLEAVRTFRHGEPMVWTQQEGEIVEEWLERLCCAMLGQARIDWSTDLLQYGDSLKFLNLQLELERLLDRDLPWLNETPSIARLAALIRDEKQPSEPQVTKDQVAIRPATRDDEAAVCQLLATGFPDIRPTSLWHRLFNYPWQMTPPTYGIVLIAEDKIVGYLGALYAERHINGLCGVVCNLTSWYIDPAYRGWGSAMLDVLFETDNTITYTALTAAPLPKEIFKQMDFLDAREQSLILVPLSHLKTLSHRPRILFDPREIRPHLGPEEARLLDDHIDTDCLHVLLRDGQQTAYMLVKRRTYQVRSWSPWLAASKVLYCGNPELVAQHLERVKLAILVRQGTMALVMLARWFATPPTGVSIESHMLIRSSVFAPSDLDPLYSELCLLPV